VYCCIVVSCVYCCSRLVCIVVSCLVCIVVIVLCVLLLVLCVVVAVLCVLYYVYLLYYVCIAVFTLDAGLLTSSRYSKGSATGHLFLLVTNFIFCIHLK